MASDPGPFAGFGPDAMSFLAGLEADNSKAYFDAHRAVYDEQVARPLKQLVGAVGVRLVDGPAPGVSYEPRIGKSMFRINRDLRFGTDKTPYHPHLDLVWWEGEHPKTSPGFILRIRPDTVLTGVGVFALVGDRLERYRAAVVGADGEDLGRIVDSTIGAVRGAALSEPTRRRVPAGFDAEHPRARYLRHDGLHLSASAPTPPSITSARFAGWVADRLGRYADLHRWLVAHT